MKLSIDLNYGAIALASCAIAAPASAQVISPIAASACTQRTAEEMLAPTRDIGVTGIGPILEAENGVRILSMRNLVTGQTAECRFSEISNSVVSVTLNSRPTPPQGVSPAAANACIVRTAEEMVVATRDIIVVNAGLVSPAGVQTLNMRNTTTGRTARCQVNTRTNMVLSVTVAGAPQPPTQPGRPGRPVAPNNPNAQRCQNEIARRIRIDYAGVDKVIFSTDTTREYFISNAVTGIQGEGQFMQRRAPNWFRFNYDCQVNVRNGRVERSTYRIIR